MAKIIDWIVKIMKLSVKLKYIIKISEIIMDMISNAGIINMETSGCPKNQNKCW